MSPSQSRKKKDKPLPLQTRLRDLGHRLGVAELCDWYGEPERFASMKKAHEAMLRKHYWGNNTTA